MAQRKASLRSQVLLHTALVSSVPMPLAACDEPRFGQPGELGHLAYSEAGTGTVMVIDVATGAKHSVSDGNGPHGSLSMSPDGKSIAFTYNHSEQLKRDVFVADIGSGEVRAITPGTGQFMPDLRWLRSGWLWYPYTQQNLFLRAAVGPQMTEARTVGGASTGALAESPVDTQIAYVDGASPQQFLVVEEPNGASRHLYPVRPSSRHTIFTPDGKHLVFAREAGLWLVSLETELLVDLGPANDTRFSSGIEGTSIFSPDGTEILVRRGQQLVAVKLDASSERVIASRAADGGFTSHGDIVYADFINTEDPPDDTPEFVYSAFVVNSNGRAQALFEQSPDCGVSRVSESGAFIGVTCRHDDRTQVFQTDGTLTFESDAGGLVGFDELETGVVLHGSVFVYATLDGNTTRPLAGTETYGGTSVEQPRFDYVP